MAKDKQAAVPTLEEQLRQRNAAKEQACLKEINLDLERHGCVLSTVTYVEKGLVLSRPVVMAKTER